MIRRVFALTHARNLEFLRDRAALIWNLVFPLCLVIGLALVFNGGARPLLHIGVLAPVNAALTPRLHPLLGLRFTQNIRVDNPGLAIRKVARHRLDMLIDLRSQPARYWVNPSNPKGYLLEQLAEHMRPPLVRQSVAGEAVSYVDWLLPGIIGMNIMFSSLFGIGYAIVRYRKNGYLKRLRATPATAAEFILAQILSRLGLVLTVSALVFVAARAITGLPLAGSGWALLLVALLGATSLIALGLVVAARVHSEELASGLLNVIAWPMMFLSGAWFSLEGASPWLQRVAELMPLTHLLEAARAIIFDGATVADVAPHLVILGVLSFLFLVLGAVLFQWVPE